MKTHCVYQAFNGSSLLYVGRSINPKTRLGELKQRTGNSALKLIIMMRTESFELACRTEKHLIRTLRPPLNKIVASAAGMLGKKHGPRARSILSRVNKGNKNAVGHFVDEEARAKLRAGSLGNKSALGSKASEAKKAKLRAAWVRRKARRVG